MDSVPFVDFSRRSELNSTAPLKSDLPEGLFCQSYEQSSLILFSLLDLFVSSSVPVCCHFLTTFSSEEITSPEQFAISSKPSPTLWAFIVSNLC